MLGYSIPGPVFLGRTSKSSPRDQIAHYETTEAFLGAIRSQGVGSIEIRILPRDADGRKYQDLIRMIWQMGFRISVHGHVDGRFLGSTFEQTYPSMGQILQRFHQYQSSLNITLHAYEAKEGEASALHRRTVALLRDWASLLEAEGLPVRLALENNRKKSGKIDPGDSISGVLQMVEEVGSPIVGICWDMGHYYANLLNERGWKLPPESPLDPLPPAAFLRRVVHTHIHGLGSSGTHHPLTEASSLPLERYVGALKQAGYRGIYNLELTLDKFGGDRTLSEHVAASVQRLKEATT